MRVLSFSETGYVRENNEDGFLVLTEYGVFAVADGMGGHSAGEVASDMAIKTIQSHVAELPNVSAEEIPSWLTKVMKSGNQTVFEYAQSLPEKEMGTTLTILLLRDDLALIAHVGDSRAYLWRDGKLSCLTIDHSLPGELVRYGKISPEEAANHPMRHRLLRALGPFEEINPEYYTVEAKAGDVFLLCTDGVTNMVSDEEIALNFNGEQEWEEKMEALKQMILERGAKDNFTALCCILD